MGNEKEIKAYVRSLSQRIENLKESEYYSDGHIYNQISSELGIIVSVFSKKHPDMTLKELEPIIKVFTDFQREYLGEE